MSMTETAAAADRPLRRVRSVCPVCEEELAPEASRCFRCTTELTSWWPLEDSLRKRTRRSYLGFLPFVLVGGVLGLAIGHLRRSPPDRAAAGIHAPATPPLDALVVPTTPSAPPEPRVVLYTVQRGDSLWRIAASLTGSGQNWRRLWPEYEADARNLRPGTSLEIPVATLQEASSQTSNASR